MPRNIKLKPCPFCGSDDVRILEHDCKYCRHDEKTGEWIPVEDSTYSADCFCCGCMTDVFNTPQKAAKFWNRRTGA